MDSAFKDKLFTSFNELQNAIQEYEEKNCVQLYKRTSRNILEKKNQEPYSVNMELKYSYIIFLVSMEAETLKQFQTGNAQIKGK
jgi:uncharacterized membrane protein